MANLLVAQLIHLESEDPDKDISLYINSPGGSVTAGLAVYDTMQYVRPDVQTICFGIAMSMGSLLLCAGAPGKRMSLPNARILIHQPSGGFQGQATDIEIHAREAIATRERVERIYAKHCGRDLDEVHADMDRDRFLGPDEAAEWGLIDRDRRVPRAGPDPDRVQREPLSGLSDRGCAGTPARCQRHGPEQVADLGQTGAQLGVAGLDRHTRVLEVGDQPVGLRRGACRPLDERLCALGAPPGHAAPQSSGASTPARSANCARVRFARP